MSGMCKEAIIAEWLNLAQRTTGVMEANIAEQLNLAEGMAGNMCVEELLLQNNSIWRSGWLVSWMCRGAIIAELLNLAERMAGVLIVWRNYYYRTTQSDGAYVTRMSRGCHGCVEELILQNNSI